MGGGTVKRSARLPGAVMIVVGSVSCRVANTARTGACALAAGWHLYDCSDETRRVALQPVLRELPHVRPARKSHHSARPTPVQWRFPRHSQWLPATPRPCVVPSLWPTGQGSHSRNCFFESVYRCRRNPQVLRAGSRTPTYWPSSWPRTAIRQECKSYRRPTHRSKTSGFCSEWFTPDPSPIDTARPHFNEGLPNKRLQRSTAGAIMTRRG